MREKEKERQTKKEREREGVRKTERNGRKGTFIVKYDTDISPNN